VTNGGIDLLALFSRGRIKGEKIKIDIIQPPI
jgi:hypothetical protein